ncbi:MAG: M20/M25/M40 family metallo-hydrolase [Candidatus Rifleibacteriota bacterium]
MPDRRAVIEPLFLRLVATQSDTNTIYEGVIEEIILTWLKSREYFKRNPDHVGTRAIAGDPCHREIVWALVKGEGDKTVILMHHHDAVDIEDYGKLRHLALRPDELKEELKKRKVSDDVRADLNSDNWIFGRGTADMKSGAAIQLSLIDEFSEFENFSGNLLLISVPDEETLSKGMLFATELLDDLKKVYNLKYIFTINSEPYFNNVKNKAIMYEGSVGKIMPIIYVKGVKSHIGDPYNGINPSLILANIQSATELNVKLCDIVSGDATPPPIWVNLKDRKKAYDASIPDAATGYFNWLTFTRSPADIIRALKEICVQALEETMKKFEKSYLDYCFLTNDEPDVVNFEPRVIEFSELYRDALTMSGAKFKEDFETYQDEVNELLMKNSITLPEAGIRLMEFTADYADLDGPTVVVAISGPYYPHVSNCIMKDVPDYELHKIVNEISYEKFNVNYISKAYFMGISDLSYASWAGEDSDVEVIRENSPGWDKIYHIPFDKLQKLKMPVVNIGPWGKDLHKTTERVFACDVYERIPYILKSLIIRILSFPDALS